MRLRQLVEKELETRDISYRKLGKEIGVSHGLIGNILADDPPTRLKDLQKFADHFKVHVRDLLDAPKDPSEAREPTIIHGNPTLIKLSDVAARLDQEELETLVRCAEAFLVHDREVSLHLIGQLKLIDDLVKSRKRSGRPRPTPTPKLPKVSGT